MHHNIQIVQNEKQKVRNKMLPNSKLFFAYYAITSKLKLFIRFPQTIIFYFKWYFPWQNWRSNDIIVVSFPKSGRTWLEQLMLSATKHKHDIKGHHDTWKDLNRTVSNIPKVGFTHGGSAWDGKALDEREMMALSPKAWVADKKVIFLYRDPRDTIVSAYHHIQKRTGISQVTPADMLENKVIGIRKSLLFMNHWLKWCDQNPDAMLLSYEDLKSNTCHELKRISDFCNSNWSRESIEFAVADCEFSRMKVRESKSRGSNPWLSPTDPNDSNSFKVRSGKSGEYAELFSKEEIETLERIIKETLSPNFPYHHEAQT